MRSRQLFHELVRPEVAAVLGGEPRYDVPDAGLADVANLAGDEIDALHERAAVDPLDSLVPPLYGWGRKQALGP